MPAMLFVRAARSAFRRVDLLDCRGSFAEGAGLPEAVEQVPLYMECIAGMDAPEFRMESDFRHSRRRCGSGILPVR